jgi:hypothetical protein
MQGQMSISTENFVVAQRGSGAFACKRCNGVAHGRQRYQSSSGATSCALCAAGGHVDAARTSCSELRHSLPF